MVESSRAYTVRKRPRIIINKSFSIFPELQVGDKGQMLINGFIEAEKIDDQLDDTELMVKTIRIEKAELLTEKNVRDIT